MDYVDKYDITGNTTDYIEGSSHVTGKFIFGVMLLVLAVLHSEHWKCYWKKYH